MPTADPLLEAINAYRGGEADFNALDIPREEEAEACQLLIPAPLAVLGAWTQPATTREDVLAALRVAQFVFHHNDYSPTVKPMTTAALAFFEAEGG